LISGASSQGNQFSGFYLLAQDTGTVGDAAAGLGLNGRAELARTVPTTSQWKPTVWLRQFGADSNRGQLRSRGSGTALGFAATGKEHHPRCAKRAKAQHLCSDLEGNHCNSKFGDLFHCMVCSGGEQNEKGQPQDSAELNRYGRDRLYVLLLS
jgi:hypothetical protein